MDKCNATKLPCTYCNPCCEHRVISSITELKYIFQIEFYYWFEKQLGLYFYWHIKDGKKIGLAMSVWEYHKMPWYDNGADWYTSWWKHIKIWKRKKVKSGINTMND